MRKTENFELNLLDGEDFVNKDVLNDNAEKIDQKLKEHDTPEYDISLQKDVENLSSGESLRVALRKIAKAVKTLIEHLANKENPHGVSAEDVGLGEVTNESKETMFTNPTFTGITNAEGYGFGDNAVHPTKVMPYEREYDDTGTTHKTTMVGINAGLHLDGDLEAANFQGLASNFTTENWKMGAAAPLVKQLYEENQSLKEEISTLNSNLKTERFYESWGVYPNTDTWGSVYGSVYIPGIRNRIANGTAVTIKCVIYSSTTITLTDGISYVVYEDWLQVKIAHNSTYGGKPMVFRVTLS